jgi:hypothetical protein
VISSPQKIRSRQNRNSALHKKRNVICFVSQQETRHRKMSFPNQIGQSGLTAATKTVEKQTAGAAKQPVATMTIGTLIHCIRFSTTSDAAEK